MSTTWISIHYNVLAIDEMRRIVVRLHFKLFLNGFSRSLQYADMLNNTVPESISPVPHGAPAQFGSNVHQKDEIALSCAPSS